MTYSITLPLIEAPRWLSHIQIERAGTDEVRIEVVKRNGASYGIVQIKEATLRSLLDLL